MNIFYTEVDPSLREELDARAGAGMFSKTTKDLQYMIEKIANVEIIAYEGQTADPNQIVGRLGGFTTREKRFLPNGPHGYLQDQKYKISNIVFDNEKNIAKIDDKEFDDQSKRVGPYATTVDITIGDHSMGLLNKASIALSIPNPKRDLDTIETIFFRPGRFVTIKIVHPESAVITRDENGNILKEIKKSQEEAQDKLIKSLKKKVASGEDLFIPKKRNFLPKMNEVSFEGLITSFDFSFQGNGAVDGTLSLTGTSNVYTEMSMYQNSTQSAKTDKKKIKKPKQNPVLDPKIDIEKKREALDLLSSRNNVSGSVLMSKSGPELIASASAMGATPDIIAQLQEAESADTGSSQFYDAFYDNVKSDITRNTQETGVVTIPGGVESILFQPDYVNQNDTDSFIIHGYTSPQTTVSIQVNPFDNNIPPLVLTNEHYEEYVTLGYLIDYINDVVIKKMNAKVPTANIYCDDSICFSNYYKHLTSCNPEEILFLPNPETSTRNSAKGLSSGQNQYGTKIYYDLQKTARMADWKGIAGKIEETDANGNVTTSNELVNFPSRIFINIKTIREIIVGKDGKGGISSGGSRGFNLKTFLSQISSKISYATARAISMSTVTHPDLQDMLLFTDRKYVNGKANSDKKNVEPYHVPIYQDTGTGTLVRDFTLNATIPESVKNLSYVLNQGDDISEEEIAPYVSFMYQNKDKDSINKAADKYRERHKKAIQQIKDTRRIYGNHSGVIEKQHALYKALLEYIKYPSDNIQVSSLLSAPIFPFSADFRIDGINGLRYGDVVQFDALPLRYRVNTVFSVISVSHNLTTDGEWTTNVKCIMRPRIE